MGRPQRAITEPTLWAAPAFPEPVSGFAGRDTELERIARHAADDVVFVVYGVGGIGKSELVYQAIRTLCSTEPWKDAIPVLVTVGPDNSPTRTFAEILAAVGASPEPLRGRANAREDLHEQLGVLAAQLDSDPYLVFIDDAHHLDPALVAEALHYLSRHVRRSRLFVASRREIPMAADAPPPVVTALGPLDAEATTRMVESLATQMAVPCPDPDELLRATKGSPFHIRQRLAPHASDRDSLEESLAALKPEAHHVLLAVALSLHRPHVEVMRATWPDASVFDSQLHELERRFLIDADQGHLKVHDLIRDSLLTTLSPDQRAAAHEAAGALCVAQLARDSAPSLMLAVDAVTHHIAARRPAEAWRIATQYHSTLAAAGCDHLLLAPLSTLREALPDHRVAVDLLRARSLVRASLIEQAQEVLDATPESRTAAEDMRHNLLAGEVAQRRGELATARELFERALERATTDAARFHARLQVATVATLEGHGQRARDVIAGALDELTEPTARQRARCAWTRVLSWVFDEHSERAASEAREARLALEGEPGVADLAARLAILETLAAIDCGDMTHARSAAQFVRVAGLRQRVASFVTAIVTYADGNAREASAELLRALDDLHREGDAINAFVAGFYAASALEDIGNLALGRETARRAGEVAREAGLRGLVSRATAQEALLAADALQCPVAHTLADQALALEALGPRSRAMAHCAHAHAYTIEGDLTPAIEHIELARATLAAAQLPAAEIAIDIERAAIELVAGQFDSAVARAEQVVAHYKGRAGDYKLSHALLILAASYVARGRRSDILFAEKVIAEAHELANRSEFQPIQIGCAIVSASLALHGSRKRAAGELLTEALREFDPERGSLYANALVGAIEGGMMARMVPGVVALLAHLGFTDAVESYLIDQHGRRAATAKDVEREHELRDLFVDAVNSRIVAKRGEVEVGARGKHCALLSELIQARGAPVTPEVIYMRVWGGSEYHPLKHRNAVYVAINRLRKSLRKALPDREVVVSAADGWQMARDLDACVAIAARRDDGA